MKTVIILLFLAVLSACGSNPTQNNPTNNDKLQLSFQVELRDSLNNDLLQTLLDTSFTVNASFIANPSAIDSGFVSWKYPSIRNAISITSKITNETGDSIRYDVSMHSNRPPTNDYVIVKPNSSIDTIRWGFGHHSPGYISVWRYFTPDSTYKIHYKAKLD